MISQSFSTKLNDISSDLGMNPRDLLLVMYLESGVNPGARNPNGGATGLIQFMPATLKGMGLSDRGVKTFGQKSAEDQLDYVKKYVKAHQGLIGGKPFTSATQYYVANFFPIALKKWNGSNPIQNANVVVVDSHSSDSRERAAYKANPILDANKDGKITVGDLTAVLMRMEQSSGFQQLVKQFNVVVGNGMVSERSILRKKNMPRPDMSEHTQSQDFLADLRKKIDNFLNSFASNQMNTHYISIISNNDLPSKLEYARILKLAMKEELNIECDILINKNDIKVKCESELKKNIVQELCNAISETFTYATKKIGGINIDIKVSQYINDTYKLLNIKTAEINYRKFHLKFATKEGKK